MRLLYSDEEDRLSSEIKKLMQMAADKAKELEIDSLQVFCDAKDTAKCKEAEIEISITVTDDDVIRELNNTYRGNDSVTDVLSFPQFENINEIADRLTSLLGAGDEEAASCLLGDVVICHDQAIRQAKEYGTGETRELIYLFVHSLMHLFGYDHMNEEGRKEMRRHEEDVLNYIGVQR